MPVPVVFMVKTFAVYSPDQILVMGSVMGQFPFTQQDVTNDYYKANTIGQCRKIMNTVMGFAHIVGQGQGKDCSESTARP